jgi:2-dehydro-3-deoxy-D-arabinonate dehydratase
VFGYTVCDDVSSRDIEGENPLYLPQAKVYAGSCALAPGIRPAWEVPDPAALGIEVRVTRAGATVFEGSTTTARMRRSVPDLVAHLVAAQDFPAGAVLSTGTAIVPGLEFTLLDGDVVQVTVEQVGTLTNPVDTLDAARAAGARRIPASAYRRHRHRGRDARAPAGPRAGTGPAGPGGGSSRPATSRSRSAWPG